MFFNRAIARRKRFWFPPNFIISKKESWVAKLAGFWVELPPPIIFKAVKNYHWQSNELILLECYSFGKKRQTQKRERERHRVRMKEIE